MELEHRHLDIYDLRAMPEKPNTLVGRAIAYGSLSQSLGNFRERVQAGALTKTLSDGHDIRALLNHDPHKLLARSSAGSLRLKEDDQGLLAEIDLPDTSYAADALALMKRGDIGGNGRGAMSFGFKVPRGGDKFHRDGNDAIRTITEMHLHEISVLMTQPAYDATPIQLRHIDPAAIEAATAIAELPQYRLRKMLFRQMLAGC